MDYFFLTDLILTFFTSVRDKDGNKMVTHKQIAIHYLKNWFIIDFVSCFPFHLIYLLNISDIGNKTEVCTGEEMYSNSFDIRFILRLLRLPKLIRIVQITKLGRKLD
jgi:hypothetical protein